MNTSTASTATGPLKGTRIVEFAGVGPGPFCAMLLADMGAEVISLDRTSAHGLGFKKETRFNPINRNRPSLSVDLKSQEGRDVALRLLGSADALIEGFRPGVMERLGLSPEACWKVNPRLVFGRMTGWGQEGPMANAVGHDLNYLAVSGLLPLLGARDRKPAIPLNVVGDFGGGGLYLALGIVSAILEAKASGKGQVVDAAMSEGANMLMAIFHGMKAAGQFQDGRANGMLNGGLPFYDTYACADGQWICIGSMEPQFYAEMIDKTGLTEFRDRPQMDPKTWADLRPRLEEVFKGKTRDEWCAILEGGDSCFAPVLTLEEAPRNKHMAARKAFIDVDGITQPAPSPRFSETPSAVRWGITKPREDVETAVAEWLGRA